MISYRAYLLFFNALLVVFTSSVFAQYQYKIDSLFAVWNDEQQPDTARLQAMDEIAWEYIYTNPDSALVFGKKGLLFAQENEKKRWEAIALNVMGGSFNIKGDYPKAIEYFLKSIAIQKEIGNRRGEAVSLSNIALIYKEQGDYPKSLEYHFKSLRIEEKLGNKKGIAISLNNIGIIYENQGDLSKALDYYLKALKIDEDLKRNEGIAGSLCNIGNIYNDRGDYPKALDYYLRYLIITETEGMKYYQANALGNIGTVYYAQGDYKNALEYFVKHLKIAEEIGAKQSQVKALGNIGSLYTKTGRFIEGEKYLQQSLAIAEDIGALDDVKSNHENLSVLYEKTGKPAKALEHYKLYIEARDSLFNEQNTKEITQREMQYEFDKQQEKEQAEQEKKDAIAAEELKREKTIGYAFMGGFGLLLVLAFVVFRSLQQKKKANKLITEQKQEVEQQKELVDEKNKEITDSITYAKRIQEAILPPQKLVKQYLEESFILYKPKDIVAGDFYWLDCVPNGTSSSKMEEAPLNPSPVGGGKQESPLPDGEGQGGAVVLFAAADCTGHGVPGAMVSVVCHNAMNRAVREFGLRSPAEILDKTNELVEETFEKSEEEVKDGMDLALCALSLVNSHQSLEKEQMTNDPMTNDQWLLEYAGANNPLYIIKNGELNVIKGDKQPVGHYEHRKPFTNHRIELQKGDCLYIFSDGFADQFGGPKGKKFKYKPFRELLLANHSKPMEEQKQLLDETIEEWRGELEQVDDICVIGVRV